MYNNEKESRRARNEKGNDKRRVHDDDASSPPKERHRTTPACTMMRLLLVAHLAFAALVLNLPGSLAAATKERRLINGGEKVSQQETDDSYGWFASLVLLDAYDRSCYPVCGGAMVAGGTMLSAAHCLANSYGTTGGGYFATAKEKMDYLGEYVVVAGFAGTWDPHAANFPSGNCGFASLTRFVAESAPEARVYRISNFQKPTHYGDDKNSGFAFERLDSPRMAYGKRVHTPPASSSLAHPRCAYFVDVRGD